MTQANRSNSGTRLILDAIVNFQSLKISNSNLSAALYRNISENDDDSVLNNNNNNDNSSMAQKEIIASKDLLACIKCTKLLDDQNSNKLFSARNVCEEIILPFVLNRLLYIVQGSISTNDNEKQTVRDGILDCYVELLVESLSLVFQKQGANVVVPSCLSQSTLQKIFPFISKLAHEANNTNASRSIHIVIKDGSVFKPSLTICQDLLMQQDILLTESLNISSEVGLAAREVIESFLSLFLLAQDDVNAKKVFQILCSDGFLAMLSRMSTLGRCHYDAVRQILLNGLFDVEHHIDGYSSAFLALARCDRESEGGETKVIQKNRKGKSVLFCYQEELFSTVKKSFYNADRQQDLTYLAALLPVLFAGFIKQFKTSGTMTVHSTSDFFHQSKKRKISETEESREFLFWKWITHDALKYILKHSSIDMKQRFVITKSIRETLQMLLDNDIYSPSNSSEETYDTLHQFSSSLLCLFRKPPTMLHSSVQKGLLAEQIKIISLVFDLNHRLYHEDLADILSIANLHHKLNVTEEASLLLSSIVTLYSKLRQLPHFFNSYYLFLSKDKLSIPHISTSKSISRSLLSAIQICPNTQIKELWEICERNIFTSSTEEVIQEAVDLFVILIQSISINPSNSRSIKKLCMSCWRHLLDTFSLNMLKEPNKKTELFLRLCGYLIELYTKCDFFHEESVYSETKSDTSNLARCNEDGFDSLLKKLTGWITNDLTPVELRQLSQSIILSLQHLSMQRIRRLHSILYLREEASLLDENESDDMVALQSEASSLVRFCFYVTTSIEKDLDSTQCWKLIAQNINIWANYSTKNHSKCFLQWLFLHNDSVEKQDIVSQIFNDTAFFETHVISSAFMDVMVDELSNTLCSMFSIQENSNLVPSISKIPLLRPSSDSWTPMTSSDFSKLLTASTREMKKAHKTFNGGLKQYIEGSANICNKIEKVCHLLMIAASIPEKVFRSNDLSCSKFIDFSIRLDAISRALMYFTPYQLLWERVCSLSRVVFARWLCGSKVVSQLCGFLQDEDISNIVTGMYESLENIFKRSSENKSMISLVFSTCKTIESITEYCIVSQSRFTKFVEGIISLTTKNLTGKEGWVLLHLIHAPIRSVLSSICCLEELVLLSKQSILTLLGALEDICLHISEKQGSFGSLLILHGDIVRLRAKVNFILESNDCLSKEEVLKADTALQRLSNAGFVKSLHEIQTSSQFLNESIYFISAFFTSQPDKMKRLALPDVLSKQKIIETIADILVDNPNVSRDSLSDITCVSFASYANHEELKLFIARLVNRAQRKIYKFSEKDSFETASSRILHNFLIIFTLVKGQEKRNCVSESVQSMIKLSHESLASSCISEEYTECALKFFNALIARKDLFLLNGQEISNILYQVSSLRGEKLLENTNVYRLCCIILCSLLKHYTKKTYSIVQNFVAALQALMCSLIESDNEDDARFLHFLKVCEIIPNHKEVLKKHIVGVILAYSSYLGAGKINIRTKKVTSQAIFLLLDVCTEFETQQLTCMMSSTDKPLFRSLFQTYHKQHKYHGQY